MSEQDILDINELLKASSAYKASDLHIKVGNPPVLRVDGRLHPMPERRRVTQEDVMKIGYSVMTDAQKEKFKRSSEIDIAYSVPGLGRFRVNVFQQRGTIGLVFRLIPVKIMTLEELDAQRAEMAQTVEKWGHQISDWTERKAEKVSDVADNTADVAAKNLEIAWANAKAAWSDVERASTDGYDAAKKRFN